MFDNILLNDTEEMIKRFTLNRDDCVLMVIDIQDRLSKAMFNEDELKKRTKILIELANIFSIPIIVTEQNPNSLGNTNEELLSSMNKKTVISKMSFSAFTPEVKGLLKEQNKRSVIISGMETHVCVFQTVRDLLANSYNVVVASDAVGSRTEKNYNNALDMMSNMNAVISNTETILFDILKTSTDDNFKKVQALIK